MIKRYRFLGFTWYRGEDADVRRRADALGTVPGQKLVLCPRCRSVGLLGLRRCNKLVGELCAYGRPPKPEVDLAPHSIILEGGILAQKDDVVRVVVHDDGSRAIFLNGELFPVRPRNSRKIEESESNG